MIKFCDQKKKDLAVIVNAINYVGKLSQQTNNEWVQCLKKRAKENPNDVKASIHEIKKKVNELVGDLIELEKVVTVDECEEISNFLNSQIIDKYYGDCPANKSLIENKFKSLSAKVEKGTEKYTAEGNLYKAANAEKERLTAFNPADGCSMALSTTIAKDRWVGDKKRKRCIAMDENNEDVDVCYYEKVAYPEGQEPAEGEERKVLVFNDDKVFWCDEPVDLPAEGEPNTDGEYHEED